MKTRRVRVSACSRLHFGLLRFAQPQGASYGGLGMMIDQPRTILEIEAANDWRAEGPLAERAIGFARLAKESFDLPPDYAAKIRVCEAPCQHSGLGTGTQLALAISRGLRELWQLPAQSASELATSVQRGQRSAVGTHGFLQGGLIWEKGREQPETLGKLAQRIAVPSQWRVVLVTLPDGLDMHGKREKQIFQSLPPVPDETADELKRLAEEDILPAVEQVDLARFSEAVHQYGRLSGSCFAFIQGGSFASRQIENLVDYVRSLGVAGVGQSSWGPTVYAFVADDSAADELTSQLHTDRALSEAQITIAGPDNTGAQIETLS